MSKVVESIPDGKFAPEDWEFILLQMVSDHSGVDFGMYRMATFRRRYMKRMTLVDARDIRGFVKMLETDTELLDQMVSDLLIGVTSFFRDAAAFRILRESVILPLFKEKKKEPVRVWVAGCSTGMEAYSIAMIMSDLAGENGRSFTIFATDISRSSLVKASKGIYTEKQFLTVPEEQKKYFNKVAKGWKIKRELRSHMVFSYHDILSDPPFAHMDLVSCRNMMIYLKPEAQTVVLDRLNYSLSLEGVMFLGSGEAPGKRQNNLKIINSRWRLFKKAGDTVLVAGIFPFEKNFPLSGVTITDGCYSGQNNDEEHGRSRSFISCLEERFFPDCVFADEDYNILFINGDMNSYLSIPPGIPGGSLLSMLPSRLKATVRAGVQRATGGFRRVQCETGEGISVYVSCISPQGMKAVYLVEFVRQDSTNQSSDTVQADSESDTSILEEQISFLETELASTRRELRSRTSELQASNEELQTTNEEIRSSNEELIASNEELIASNEELQSVNQRLSILSDDMMNLLESMDVGSLFLDSELKIRRFNPVICNFFKITDGDIGRSITDFTTTLANDSIESLLLAAKEVAISGIILEVTLDTEYPGFWLAKVSPYKASNGTIHGTVITFVDITLIHEGEVSLAGSEQKFRRLFDGFPIGAIFVSHSSGIDKFTILNTNPEFKRLQEKNIDLATNQRFIQGIMDEEPVFLFNHGISTFRGESFRPEDCTDVLCVTLQDVTTENKINNEKEILQKRLKDSQLLAGMGIWEYDSVMKMVSLSSEAAELFGMGPELSIPLNVFRDRIVRFDEFFRAAQKSLSTGKTYSGMIEMHSASSKTRKHFKVRAYAGDARGQIQGFVLNMTSEMISRKTLRDANDRLSDIQEVARIGIVDMEWKDHYAAHRERFHYTAIQVLKLSESDSESYSLFRNMDYHLALKVLLDLKEAAREKRIISFDIPVENGLGESIYLQMVARPDTHAGNNFSTTLVIMDVTRRHQLENELKHSDKLRSVGELAGGIAHDFNNQLMGIVGFAECLRGMSCNAEQLEYLKGILSSAERAGTLVRQLLAFSRKGLSQIAPFDLHKLIDDVISLLKRSIDRRIEIRRSFRAEYAVVIGDASEMNNAVLNMAINARDAMDGVGTITFSTINSAPNMIKLEISDTGMGMSHEVLQKAFEPFFTTKPLGEGTGMGLSAVYGTITAHQGTITLNSNEGEGTTAVVMLPTSKRETVSSAASQIVQSGVMEGTILLVDDELIVRTVLQNLIKALGFTVMTAVDGVEAVEVFRENREEIKLVLMDMTMPRKNGVEAFTEMREISPDVKVVILSGHSAESSSNEMIKLGIKRVLQKPVTISVLSTAIKETIGG